MIDFWFELQTRSVKSKLSLIGPQAIINYKYVLLMFQGKAPVIEAETDPLRYILLGLVAGLVVVLTVLTTSLMCTRRK